MTKNDDYTLFTVRIPTAIYEKLRRISGEKNVNSEFLTRLESTILQDDALDSPTGHVNILDQYNTLLREQMSNETDKVNVELQSKLNTLLAAIEELKAAK